VAHVADGGPGPPARQNHHFQHYAPEKIPYAIDRYVKETNRLYGVLDKRLAGRDFILGKLYSIADMAAYPGSSPSGRARTSPTSPTSRAGTRPSGRVRHGRAYALGEGSEPAPRGPVTDQERKILRAGQGVVK